MVDGLSISHEGPSNRVTYTTMDSFVVDNTLMLPPGYDWESFVNWTDPAPQLEPATEPHYAGNEPQDLASPESLSGAVTPAPLDTAVMVAGENAPDEAAQRMNEGAAALLRADTFASEIRGLQR